MSRSAIVVVIICSIFVVAIVFVPASSRGNLATRDSAYIRAIYGSWLTFARENDGVFPTPGLMKRLPDPLLGTTHPGRGPEDITQNTTANLYSMCIMQNYFGPDLLIGPSEPSELVREMESYDFDLYDPDKRIWWDPAFQADLTTLSHVSYAHLPITRTSRDLWRSSTSAKVPLLGNRGPLNGDESIDSITKRIHAPHDRWSGNLCFADGSVSFFDSLAAATQSIGGNPFAAEVGEITDSPIITFTKEMTETGPVIQHD